jgi:glycosyltransferase involved in cell wall biosynthesis
MKRILHIIAQIPDKTGSGIFLQGIIKEADKKGYEQGLIAGMPYDQVGFGLESNKEIKFYPVIFETDEMPFSVVGMSDIMPYKSTRYRDLSEEMYKKWRESFARAIIEAVDDLKPQLIISHHLWILTALVKELIPQIPVISICHGTDIRQLTLASSYADYVIKGCKKTELIFALNNHQKEIIIEKYGVKDNNVIVIGGGYNSDIFYPPVRKKRRGTIRLIYAGKLSFSKGVPALIEAYNDIEFEGDDIELLLAGSGSGVEEKVIKNMTSNCKNKIRLLGPLTQRELADIFRSSDVFILPSFYEGFSLVLIEALACGLAAVSTELPVIKSWLSDKMNYNGIVKFVELPRLINIDVPCNEDLPKFVSELREAIVYQVGNIESRKLYDNDNLYKCIREMSWEGIFNKIESYICNIANQC